VKGEAGARLNWKWQIQLGGRKVTQVRAEEQAHGKIGRLLARVAEYCGVVL